MKIKIQAGPTPGTEKYKVLGMLLMLTIIYVVDVMLLDTPSRDALSVCWLIGAGWIARSMQD